MIDTEVHNDHTFGHWVFSPPALVINAEGAGAAMKKQFDPKRVETLAKESPEMAEAAKGYKMIVPQIEYRNRMTINLGERTFELINLKNVHSEADTAVWLPKERVLFAASAANVKSIINLRPFVRIPDVLASYKLMKSLNPEIVVPGHGAVSTTKIFDEYGSVLYSVDEASRRNGGAGKISGRDQKRAQDAGVRRLGRAKQFAAKYHSRLRVAQEMIPINMTFSR